ncbi:MAG: DUF4844 domain-containing protein [Burkholderiales bacterium]
MKALSRMREQPKFQPGGLYLGCRDEQHRLHLEGAVNALVDRINAGLPNNPTKSYVLSEFNFLLNTFVSEDTEERERVCGYLEQIMDCVGIESSEGLLNNWMYGFDPK